MVEWIVSAADRAYPAVEKAKKKTFDRFSAPIDASDEHLKEFLASTGNLPFDQLDGKLTTREQQRRERQWAKYLRKEAKSAPMMKDLCNIF